MPSKYEVADRFYEYIDKRLDHLERATDDNVAQNLLKPLATVYAAVAEHDDRRGENSA